jgi:redox-sensitive bicupin YhaK (pirin superfamily)
MAKPHFIMHWHEEIPVAELPGAKVVVHAGTFNGKVSIASSPIFRLASSPSCLPASFVGAYQ